jgi:hypothetical protein
MSRGRGWGVAILLALATAVLSVVSPALLIFVPLALLLVGLPPRQPVLLLAAAAVGVALFGRPEPEALWYLERGWALLVAAWFLLLVVVRPQARFLPRALVAVGAATLSAALLFAATRGGWTRTDWAIAQQLRAGAADIVALWGPGLATAEWGAQLQAAIYRASEVQVAVYPALLALGSLAALGVAWWGYRRLALREAAPLGRFREFRFPDVLVWVLIAGLVLVLLPLGEAALRAGSNLLTFMAALYALRGLAVLVVLVGAAPGFLAVVLGALAILFLYPLVVAATLVVGLSDTWLDLRARRRAAPRPGT